MNPTEVAKANVRAALGLSENSSTWTNAEQIAYNKALATYIAGNPDSFSDAQVTAANAVINRDYGTSPDTSFTSSLSEFGSAFVDEAISAGEAVGGIGNGVLNLASLMRWLVPVTGIVLVGLFVWHIYSSKIKRV